LNKKIFFKLVKNRVNPPESLLESSPPQVIFFIGILDVEKKSNLKIEIKFLFKHPHS